MTSVALTPLLSVAVTVIVFTPARHRRPGGRAVRIATTRQIVAPRDARDRAARRNRRSPDRRARSVARAALSVVGDVISIVSGPAGAVVTSVVDDGDVVCDRRIRRETVDRRERLRRRRPAWAASTIDSSDSVIAPASGRTVCTP